ncbi:nucleotide-diphospho-sugar transferase [Saitoella complicata NRRL Y-17804]|nr:nucleotide-diphospho-sugar transferase [Saitoella complicata NRRL Y-17804]ODQ54744.1 nucleotide-diphospho-sugar transferase [Saitoella complicata NRRL Y-17804]
MQISSFQVSQFLPASRRGRLIFGLIVTLFSLLFLMPGPPPHQHIHNFYHDHFGPPPAPYAIVTNVQNEAYVPYALTLGYTIQKYNDLRDMEADMVIMIPRVHDIRPSSLSKLQRIGWKIRFVDDIQIGGSENLQSNYRRNFLKFWCWTWVEYRMIAFIDADCLVRGDISRLLNESFGFGAVPDCWPDDFPSKTFNAGVLSLTPSVETFDALLKFTGENKLPWDAEQGVLNRFFSLPDDVFPERSRRVIPLTYNLNLLAFSNYREEWDGMWDDARIVHFTVAKPRTTPCVENCYWEEPKQEWINEWDEMRRRYGWTSKLPNMA